MPPTLASSEKSLAWYMFREWLIFTYGGHSTVPQSTMQVVMAILTTWSQALDNEFQGRAVHTPKAHMITEHYASMQGNSDKMDINSHHGDYQRSWWLNVKSTAYKNTWKRDCDVLAAWWHMWEKWLHIARHTIFEFDREKEKTFFNGWCLGHLPSRPLVVILSHMARGY